MSIATAPRRDEAEGLSYGKAFGIRIQADFALDHLAPDDQALQRVLRVRSASEVAHLPRQGTEVLVERRGREGLLELAVDHHVEHGYRTQAPGYGEHLLAPDGRELWCSPPGPDRASWHRLFFAQILPSAAALQGLELLHAAAVSVGGRALAIIGASGAGKSSLAAHLVALGADLITDDVLAVEPQGHGLVAHPGPWFAQLDPAEHDRVPAERRHRLGGVISRGDKLRLTPVTTPRPVPLARMYYLCRDPDARELLVERLAPPDPRLLLASTFVAHLPAERRLVAQLDTCAQLALRVPCMRIRVPPWVDAAATAQELWRRGPGR